MDNRRQGLIRATEWAGDCCGAGWLKNSGAAIVVKFKWRRQLARSVWWPEFTKEGAEERTFSFLKGTWEPEDNLKVSGDEILNEYFDTIGGRDKIFKESDRAAKTKKGRQTTNGTFSTRPKRLQRNEAHVGDGTLLAKQCNPPSGSWEDEIETIGACEEDDNGKLIVYLIWKNGQKTKHETQIIYKKCPQKMLQFYEKHVKIIGTEKNAMRDGTRAF
ncbi:hypothetical protein BKA56DRAFT_564165 [Ilyonectria sp. MPI-CAGE-AT-0026]|nr:hypothetical protein BKA56DRAFT_564165 [Ilyonectria sp. MPI-CAGE-AT-0026]